MITFELITLNGVKFGDEVHEVILPTPDGLIAVFTNHMPLVSLAVPGVISIRRNQNDTDEKMQHYATNGGIVEINGKRVRLLADEADHSSDISEKEIAKALELAKVEAKNAKDQVSLDKANQIIQTHQARLRVAEIRRRHKKR